MSDKSEMSSDEKFIAMHLLAGAVLGASGIVLGSIPASIAGAAIYMSGIATLLFLSLGKSIEARWK